MPRYFFHVHDGKTVIDTEGMVLEDVAQARQMAIRMAGQIFDDEAELVARGSEWRMEVADERGVTLLRLDFFVTDAQALGVDFEG